MEHVYKADSRMTQTGTLTAIVEADDSVGNRAVVTRQLGVQTVGPEAPVVLRSVDLLAQLALDQGTVDHVSWMTVDADNNPDPTPTGEAIGPVYRLGPLSTTLNRSGHLSIEYRPLENNKELHLGIYVRGQDGTWNYIPTGVDVATKRLQADVRKLGESYAFSGTRR